jgi:hypothetical protein
VKDWLLRLAIWRCRRAGLSTKGALELLKPLREKFHAPASDTLSKKLASMAHDVETRLFRRLT